MSHHSFTKNPKQDLINQRVNSLLTNCPLLSDTWRSHRHKIMGIRVQTLVSLHILITPQGCLLPLPPPPHPPGLTPLTSSFCTVTTPAENQNHFWIDGVPGLCSCIKRIHVYQKHFSLDVCTIHMWFTLQNFR